MTLSLDKKSFVDMAILPRTNDIGGFEVARALPFKNKRMVGPFIFFDQMGPGEFITGKGLDVRPHPHINLSTVTYLFDGEIDHRDSLGTYQTIKPGAVNLMTAGSGIVHSERSGDDQRAQISNLFGIQSWLALPKDKEEMAPDFAHIPKLDLPIIEDNKIKMRLIMGDAFGQKSPVPEYHNTLYLDISLDAGGVLNIPGSIAEEKALYALSGQLKVGDTEYAPNQMLILSPDRDITIEAITPTRLVLIGGATMNEERYIWWNFVSSSKERIEQAKEDWKNGRFTNVPGDDQEFIPLP
ncbi:MAG: pirin family protein [Pseudomonadota bacterium]